MLDTRMPPYSPETIRWLKAQGFFDVGTSFRFIGGFSKYPKHQRWGDVTA